MGKLTISMAIFNSYVNHYQRVSAPKKTPTRVCPLLSSQAIKKELADMHATAHRDTDRRGKKLADLHSDIEHVHKTASSGGDISCLLQFNLLQLRTSEIFPGWWMPWNAWFKHVQTSVFPHAAWGDFEVFRNPFWWHKRPIKQQFTSFFLRTHCGNCAGRITSVSPTCWFWNRPVVLFHVRCRVPRIVPMSSPLNTSHPGSTSLPLGQLSPCLKNPAFML